MMDKEKRPREQVAKEINKLNKIITGLKTMEDRYESMENSLKTSEKKYRELIDSLPMGIVELDRDGIILNTNKIALKLLGCKRTDMLHKHFTSIDAIEEKNLPQYFKLFDFAVSGERKLSSEAVFKDKKGNEIFLESRFNLVKSGTKVMAIQVIINDVTERKKIENKLEYLRFRDPLTGLFNRPYMDEEIKRLDEKRQQPLSFIVGDINGLKLINDAFGNDEGDRLLCRVADVFRKACRKEDIISRYGEDEFAVLLPKINKKTVTGVKKRILEMCREISKEQFHFILSLGAATREDPESDFKD
ncbi:MAG: diguanylate cyclase, partial [Actinomycetia bacterium]|nr:diguanylate cyclase [Actinomycetes bacterium]